MTTANIAKAAGVELKVGIDRISALFHGARARLYRIGRTAWRVARLWYL